VLGRAFADARHSRGTQGSLATAIAAALGAFFLYNISHQRASAALWLEAAVVGLVAVALLWFIGSLAVDSWRIAVEQRVKLAEYAARAGLFQAKMDLQPGRVMRGSADTATPSSTERSRPPELIESVSKAGRWRLEFDSWRGGSPGPHRSLPCPAIRCLAHRPGRTALPRASARNSPPPPNQADRNPNTGSLIQWAPIVPLGPRMRAGTRPN
jgi:hypothetical protein